MKRVGTFVGSFIVGLAIMGAWSALAANHGVIGGWIAALVIVFPTWFMNHCCGLIHQEGAWIDQGLALGAAGFVKGIVLDGAAAGFEALPLLLVVIAGGALGGILADRIDRAKSNS